MQVSCIIQANRYGWDGREDYCMRKIENKYLIQHVIEAIKERANIDDIIIAVSDIQENDIFIEIAIKHGIKCYKGSPDDVLDRFIEASNRLKSNLIVKTLGQNCFLDVNLLKNMLSYMEKYSEIEFLQMPDDFETKFTSEIFKKETLNKIRNLIVNCNYDENTKKKFLTRPMSFVKSNKNKFNVAVYKEIPNYTNEYLMEIRDKAKLIYNEGDSTDINYNNQIENGNFFMERYKFAGKYINNNNYVLDIACGSGYGTKYIYDNITNNIIGADLNKNIIKLNKKKYSKINFQFQDATKTTYNQNTFDVILSMETFEHIPLELVDNYLKEMRRVLKNGGKFICSTPQNNNGEIPVVPWHEKEYSLEEFRKKLSKYFYVKRIFGSKNGIFTDDEKGNGMMAICEKC